MNHLLDDDDDLGHHRSSSRDKEVTLGTGMVLGIFFALALICAVFFGFGYTLGRKSAQPAPVAETTETTPAASNSNFSNFKPTPAGTASQPKKQADSDSDAAAVTTPSAPPVTPAPKSIPKPSSGTPLASTPPIRATAPASVEKAAASPVPVTSQGGNLVVGGQAIMVQIAAVSHQEDAEVLTSALKRHGYSVSNHTNTGDKLIHVQIGPFGNKKDAEAMRQRLQGDGYNAILK